MMVPFLACCLSSSVRLLYGEMERFCLSISSSALIKETALPAESSVNVLRKPETVSSSGVKPESCCTEGLIYV